MPSSRWESTTTTGIPASRICSTVSQGPSVVSVMISVGASSRIASPDRSCPLVVTTGRSAISGKSDEESRPTTLPPSPSSNRIREVEPYRSSARTRLVSVTVTSVPCASVSVTGSAGRGSSATGSTGAAAATAVCSPSQARGSSRGVRSASGARSPATAALVPVAPATPVQPASTAATTAATRAGTARRVARRGGTCGRAGMTERLLCGWARARGHRRWGAAAKVSQT